MLAAQPGDQIARRPQGNHATVVHDRHPIAQPLSLFHVVRGQQGRAPVPAALADDFGQLAAGVRIEAGGVATDLSGPAFYEVVVLSGKQ